MILIIVLTAVFTVLLLLTPLFSTGDKVKEWLRLALAVLLMLIGVRLCVAILHLAWILALIISAIYLALILYAALWIDRKIRRRRNSE